MNGVGSSNDGGIINGNKKKKKLKSAAVLPPAGVKNGWFEETECLWPGQKFALALEVSVSMRKSNEGVNTVPTN